MLGFRARVSDLRFKGFWVFSSGYWGRGGFEGLKRGHGDSCFEGFSGYMSKPGLFEAGQVGTSPFLGCVLWD